MSRLPSKETIKRATIKDMKALGVHKQEYNRIIDIYSDLVYQYNEAMQAFELSGRQYETETAAGGTKKSATAASLEILRKDIIAYSDRLGLTPKAYESITAEVKKVSSLAQALDRLEG